MTFCACGCGKEIIYQPWHKQRPSRFIHGHGRRGTVYLRFSKRRIPPDTLCACGCGQIVPEVKPSGKPRYIDNTDRIYCTHHKPYPKGVYSHKWKGGKYYHEGYVHIYQPNHPDSDKDGYVLEHRFIWEQHNRPLLANEDVHHINGIRDDNRLENLVAIVKNEHIRIHHPNGIPSSRLQKQIAGRKGAEIRWRQRC